MKGSKAHHLVDEHEEEGAVHVPRAPRLARGQPDRRSWSVLQGVLLDRAVVGELGATSHLPCTRIQVWMMVLPSHGS